MNLKFITIENPSTPLATIHITGKLGINRRGIDLMKIDSSSFYKIGIDNSKKALDAIYLVPSSKEESGSIKPYKSATYYYFNLSSVFDNLNLDYKRHLYKLPIEKVIYDGVEIFKLSIQKKVR